MTNEFNFLIGNILPTDKEIFFGPVLKDDCFIELKHDCLDIADVMVIASIFPSKSQAVKAGKSGPIPPGFTDFRVGKSKTRITILKI